MISIPAGYVSFRLSGLQEYHTVYIQDSWELEIGTV
jgi:hypothetical protein